MKKLLFILLPLAIVMGIFAVVNTRDLSFNYLLSGLKNLEFEEVPVNAINDMVNSMDFASSWQSINGFQDVMYALAENFITFFIGIWNTLQVAWLGITAFVKNITIAFDFIRTYLFGF